MESTEEYIQEKEIWSVHLEEAWERRAGPLLYPIQSVIFIESSQKFYRI